MENRASYEFNQRTVVIRRFEGLKERRSSIARAGTRLALNAEKRLYAAFRRRWYEEDRDLMNFPAKQIKWKPCFEWVSCSCSFCYCFVEIIEILVRYSSLYIFVTNWTNQIIASLLFFIFFIFWRRSLIAMDFNNLFKWERSLFIDLFVKYNQTITYL